MTVCIVLINVEVIAWNLRSQKTVTLSLTKSEYSAITEVCCEILFDIGLMEVVWKVLVVILNCLLTASITLQNFLHDFGSARGTGTATLEAKLLQKLAAMREEVLCVIFLYLKKAYDALDRDRCLEILEVYVVGPCTHLIPRVKWDRLWMVACTGGYYRTVFHGFWEATQVGPSVPHHIQFFD